MRIGMIGLDTSHVVAFTDIFQDDRGDADLADIQIVAGFPGGTKLPVSRDRVADFSAQLAVKGVEIVGAATWGLCQTQDNIPDFFFYGIHGIEGLFALIGRGCVSVQCTHLSDADVVVGTWNDGRIGTYRGIRKGKAAFGATVFGSEGIKTVDMGIPYRELCTEIARFFKTGIAPVELDETIEIFSFMEAAEESKRTGGKKVKLER